MSDCMAGSSSSEAQIPPSTAQTTWIFRYSSEKVTSSLFYSNRVSPLRDLYPEMEDRGRAHRADQHREDLRALDLQQARDQRPADRRPRRLRLIATPPAGTEYPVTLSG
jgi:hypothetical protein